MSPLILIPMSLESSPRGDAICHLLYPQKNLCNDCCCSWSFQNFSDQEEFQFQSTTLITTTFFSCWYLLTQTLFYQKWKATVCKTLLLPTERIGQQQLCLNYKTMSCIYALISQCIHNQNYWYELFINKNLTLTKNLLPRFLIGTIGHCP